MQLKRKPVSREVNRFKVVRAVSSKKELSPRPTGVVRFQDATKRLGPSFRGKRLVTQATFEHPELGRIRFRLIQSTDAGALNDYYRYGLSPHSKELYSVRPWHRPQTQTHREMQERLRGLFVDRFPSLAQQKMIQDQAGRAFEPAVNYLIEQTGSKGKNGTPLGTVNIKYLTSSNPIFGLGFIDRVHGRALGTAAMNFAVEIGRQLGLRELHLTHNLTNAAAHMYEQAEFEFAGSTEIDFGGNRGKETELKRVKKLQQ